MYFIKPFTTLLCLLFVLAKASQAQNSTLPLPTRFGYILFPGFQALDVFGPLDALNVLSSRFPMNLTLLSSTLDPVATDKVPWWRSPQGSTFGESVLPTHTFSTAPELEVLLVPGGLGTRAPAPLLDETVAFIKNSYPKLRYLITTCTGSWLAARAGVLDGRRATSNKLAWANVRFGCPYCC